MSDLPELVEGTLLPDERGRRFVLEKQIGRGGFSEVFLARLEQGDGLVRRVALKLLHPGLSPEGQPLERMRDEAKLLARLDHPAILSAQELVRLGGRVAMISEYIDGIDFKDCLQEGMPKGPILEVIEQVADALHVAWTEHQVVHRDIKPANIRIGAYGNVKLLDFGIARYEGMTRDANTTSGTLLGTLTYLAPERFDLTVAAPEPASDVFALGCVLFEAWTGARFFGGLEASTLLRLTEDADHFDSYLDERLTERSFDPIGPLLADMLSFHPDERPTALEVARRCEQLANTWPGRLTLRRWCRGRRWPDPANPIEDTPPPILTSKGVAVSASTLSSVLDAPTVPVPEGPRGSEDRERPATPLAWPDLAWADELLATVPRPVLVGAAGIAAMLLLVTVVVVVAGSWGSSDDALAVASPDLDDPARLPVTAPVEDEPSPPVEPAPRRRQAPVRRVQRAPTPPVVTPEVVEEPPSQDPAAPRYAILVTSVPPGAEIRISGEMQAYTPHTLELTSGTYTMALSLDDAGIDRMIKVGPFAKGYVWCVESETWKSTSSSDWREAATVCEQ